MKKKERGSGRFLWEVKGGVAKMYLNGTVHIVPKDVFPLKKEITNAFDECNNFVCEIVVRDETLEALNFSDDIINNDEYIYGEGDSLYNHFDRSKVMKLRDYLVKNNMCSSVIGRKFYKLRPFAVKLIVYKAILYRSGLDVSAMGIDQFLTRKAISMKKNIIALETVEYQKELLEKTYNKDKHKLENDAEINKSILSKDDETLNILNLGWLDKQFIFRFSPWISSFSIHWYGNLYTKVDEKYIRLMSPKEHPLFGNRNEKMAEKIESYLKTNDSYFVAVGAAHYVGEENIIEILEKKGYKIERIL